MVIIYSNEDEIHRMLGLQGAPVPHIHVRSMLQLFCVPYSWMFSVLVNSWKCVCILFYGCYHILCIARADIVALTHSFAFLELLKVLLTVALLHRFLVGSFSLAVNISIVASEREHAVCMRVRFMHS